MDTDRDKGKDRNRENSKASDRTERDRSGVTDGDRGDRGSDRSRAEKREKGGLFGFLNMGRREAVSEDEIKDMVTDASELLDDEKRMIYEILDLGDMTVHEIMKPRVDVILVEDTQSGRAALERMRGTGHSRLPVFHDNIDDIVGIVYYKDLIGPLIDGRIDEPVTKFMYKPMFVPETKDVLPLLSEMQEARQQMAIVVDEYGGTDGLITIEDIVEEIIGEIVDESDLDGDLIRPLEGQAWRVDGRFPVEEALKLGWPVTDSDDYETIAGWLMDLIDVVPQTGDQFTVDGYLFKIEKMRRARISGMRVEKVCEDGQS